MASQRPLHLLGGYVLPAPDHHVIDPSGDHQVTVAVCVAEIPGPEEPLLVDGFPRTTTVVADHQERPPEGDLTFLFPAQPLPVGTEYPHLDLGMRVTFGCEELARGRVGPGGADVPDLGHPERLRHPARQVVKRLLRHVGGKFGARAGEHSERIETSAPGRAASQQIHQESRGTRAHRDPVPRTRLQHQVRLPARLEHHMGSGMQA